MKDNHLTDGSYDMSKASRTETASTAAVIYCRVSTEEQAVEGVSLDAQQSTLLAYCTLRQLDVAAVVVDAGISAGKPLHTRPGGRQVLEMVNSGTVAHVVAYKLDRLFRDACDCLAVTAEWDRQELALHLVDMGGQAIDTSTAMGRFMLTVLAGAAEMERNLISERTRAALAHKASKGERVGQVPYGCRLAADGVHLETDPAERRVIELVKELRAEGLSFRAIAARLNDTNTAARGRCWHPTSVTRLLAREAA